ncbi:MULTISPECIES: hypothetical protein [unclassified Psychrobacter]|jgi:hypothetical protein|uniref:hypothetical protein n=1 Tax=unclassified Psychrobacter TaxID=196806 RepID=UPI0009472A7A|nr:MULTISPECIES: hypothetical protein [unclassified Psychrobacter]OLF34657.1 hypothetical protein BTW00_12515 [Psychrobacter sp. C 20.9]
MNNKNRLIELNNYFIELRKILIQENENNFIRGIDVILNRIQHSLNYDENAKATIESVGDTYSFMNSGNGSFSDFFIWRENFDERVEVNEVLIELRNKITFLIASVNDN